MIRQLVATGWSDGACLNVNFPDVEADVAGPLTVSRQGRGLVQAIDVRAHVDPRGIPYHWLQFSRAPRADVDDAEAVVVARYWEALWADLTGEGSPLSVLETVPSDGAMGHVRFASDVEARVSVVFSRSMEDESAINALVQAEDEFGTEIAVQTELSAAVCNHERTLVDAGRLGLVHFGEARLLATQITHVIELCATNSAAAASPDAPPICTAATIRPRTAPSGRCDHSTCCPVN